MGLWGASKLRSSSRSARRPDSSRSGAPELRTHRFGVLSTGQTSTDGTSGRGSSISRSIHRGRRGLVTRLDSTGPETAWETPNQRQTARRQAVQDRKKRPQTLVTTGWKDGGWSREMILGAIGKLGHSTFPRDPSTSSKGTWTLQTHPKHLLGGYLDP